MVSAFDGVASSQRNEINDAEGQPPRKQIKNIETMACKYLSPYGVSAMDGAPMSKVWKAATASNKYLAYRSECADDEAARRGIALSRYAETLCSIGPLFENPQSLWKKVIVAKVYDKGAAEYKELKAALQTIDGGKTGKAGLFDKQSSKDEAEVKRAVATIYAFGKKTGNESTLRALIYTLRAGGATWSIQAADSTFKAATHNSGGKLSQEDTLAAATARLCSSATDVDDTPDTFDNAFA